MKRIGILLLAVCVPSHAAGPTPATRAAEFSAEMDISVATDGSVASVVPDATLPAPVRQLLVQRVSQWRYRPATWQGRNVPYDTRVALRLQGVPTTQGGYALRVLGFGSLRNPESRWPAPPRYPPSAQRQGIGGTFIYAVMIDTDGDVAELRLIDSPQIGGKYQKELDQASREAILAGKFSPAKVEGNAVACVRLVPMSFATGEPIPDTKEAREARKAMLNALRGQVAESCPLATLETEIENTLL